MTKVKANGETYNVFAIGERVVATMTTRSLTAGVEYVVISKTDDEPHAITYTLTNANAGLTGLVAVRNAHVLLQAA